MTLEGSPTPPPREGNPGSGRKLVINESYRGDPELLRAAVTTISDGIPDFWEAINPPLRRDPEKKFFASTISAEIPEMAEDDIRDYMTRATKMADLLKRTPGLAESLGLHSTTKIDVALPLAADIDITTGETIIIYEGQEGEIDKEQITWINSIVTKLNPFFRKNRIMTYLTTGNILVDHTGRTDKYHIIGTGSFQESPGSVMSEASAKVSTRPETGGRTRDLETPRRGRPPSPETIQVRQLLDAGQLPQQISEATGIPLIKVSAITKDWRKRQRPSEQPTTEPVETHPTYSPAELRERRIGLQAATQRGEDISLLIQQLGISETELPELLKPHPEDFIPTGRFRTPDQLAALKRALGIDFGNGMNATTLGKKYGLSSARTSELLIEAGIIERSGKTLRTVDQRAALITAIAEEPELSLEQLATKHGISVGYASELRLAAGAEKKVDYISPEEEARIFATIEGAERKLTDKELADIHGISTGRVRRIREKREATQQRGQSKIVLDLWLAGVSKGISPQRLKIQALQAGLDEDQYEHAASYLRSIGYPLDKAYKWNDNAGTVLRLWQARSETEMSFEDLQTLATQAGLSAKEFTNAASYLRSEVGGNHPIPKASDEPTEE